MLRDVVGTVAQRDAQLNELTAENEKLQSLIVRLLRHRFGRRSEKLTPEQLLLAVADLEQEAAECAAEAEAKASEKTKERRSKPPQRNLGSLPAHLPRREVVLDIDIKVCPCCKGELHRIGETTTEMLDLVPAQLRVKVLRRPRYGCRKCEACVVQALAPERPIDGGMATEALVAHVVISKFCDFLPLHRQSQMLARQGIQIDRSTLGAWVGRACWWLRPLYQLTVAQVMPAAVLFADDTTLPVLEPGRGKTRTGRLWCYAVDNRPWQGPGPVAAAYVYSEDRSGEHPAEHLAAFHGKLQVDGYKGFSSLARKRGSEIELVFCWAHTIRTQSTSATALGLIAGRLASERNDMLDLQCVVVDDDALDDQLEYRLPLAWIGCVQPGADAPAERGKARQCLTCLQSLIAEPKQPLVLLLGQVALLGEGSPLARQFIQADHLSLVGLE